MPGVNTTRLLLPALVYGAILFLSSLSADQLSDRFGDLPDWLDYVGHAVEYAVLGTSLRWALTGTRRAFSVTVLLGTVLAAGDELFQSTVPGRDPSVWDLTVDVIALSVAAWGTARLRDRHGSASRF